MIFFVEKKSFIATSVRRKASKGSRRKIQRISVPHQEINFG